MISLANTLSGKDPEGSIYSHSDPFGIKKTLILLTKPNKVIAVSAYNGNIQWSFYSRVPVSKVYVEQSAGSNLVFDIILVTNTGVIYLDPVTGNIVKSENFQDGVSADTHDFMLVNGQSAESSHQVVLAVPRSGSRNQAYIVPSSEAALSTLQSGRPLFYSQFNTEKNTISGF